MKWKFNFFCIMVVTTLAKADIISLTATAPTGTSATNQIVIQTNQTAQILHLRDLSGQGQVTIIKDNANLTYTESRISSAGNNLPIVSGPATILVTAIQPSSFGGNDNILCTISVAQTTQIATNQFIPNTGVVIPADSGGPVTIVLESSVDLINWIPADPGTYGTSTTNRFFRVRATR